MRPMYPPSDESDEARRHTGETDGVMYLLWAMMLVQGTMHLVAKDDVPFGVVEIATALAGAAARPLRERRTAKLVVNVVLAAVMIASAIVEINGGHNVRGAAIFAVVGLLIVVVVERARKRRNGSKQSAPSHASENSA